VGQQGEGLSDVGTHLVDLVPWVLFPRQALDAAGVHIDAAKRWPTVMSAGEFQRVTGEAEFPPWLAGDVKDGRLHYYCNTQVSYRVRGVHVKLDVLWDYEAAAGAGDTHFAVFRGSRSRVEVRQRKEQNFKPELFVVPNAGERDAVGAALERKVQRLQATHPGVGVRRQGDEFWVTIPDKYRVGHEAHFAEVTHQFLRYLDDPKALPAWEKPNMLAKYFTTTEGVRRARQAGG
jgi:hypothetical protein